MSELGRRDPRNLQSLSYWGSITCWTVSIERKDRIKEVNFYFYVVDCLSKYLSRSWTMNCLVMITLEEDKRFWCVWLPIHNIFRPLLYLPVDSQYSLPVEFTRWDRWLNIPARWGKYITRPSSLETDARFVFELDKEWGSMPPDK